MPGIGFLVSVFLLIRLSPRRGEFSEGQRTVLTRTLWINTIVAVLYVGMLGALAFAG